MASTRVEEIEYEIPELAGWAIIPVAAGIVGLSRQWLSDLANSGELKSARRIRGTGKRPAAIIVRMAEVQNLRQAVEDTKTCTECRKERNAGKPPARCTHREQPADEAEAAEALGVPA
jgi:hypothetical protein